jgi:hypothetical protein
MSADDPNAGKSTVEIYQSMVERPLPFFGAGGEAAAVVFFLVFTATNIAGLISWTTLASLLIGAVATWLIKFFRKVDPFGPESFVVGATTPTYFKKGYDLTEPAQPPYNARPPSST